jgi:hypothetical protein
MRAYTVHAYTTDSTEGIIIDHSGTIPDAELLQLWMQTPEGRESLGSCEPERLFLSERPILIIP